MSNEDFGLIFAAGTVTYAFSFLINGPLVDKIGGKRGILIAAIGAAAANVALGIITWLVLTNRMHVRAASDFSVVLRAQHVFPELRRGLDHQGEGALVSCARTRRVRRDFRNADFASAFISHSTGDRPSST